jgi:hypothetical protein
MTTQEFSNTFDTLLNSYNIQANFGEGASKQEITLDEYEKSVLLTQAQDLVVKSYFYSDQNSQGQGFDDSERRQVDFSSLIKTATLTKASNQGSVFDDRGIIYQMPKKTVKQLIPTTDPEYDQEAGGQQYRDVEVDDTTDVLFILNEKLVVTEGDPVTKKENYVIVPLNYKEYDREMSKAYSQPLKKQAWRLFQNQSAGFDVQSELIPIWDISEELAASTPTKTAVYKIRYVKRPDPIVLVNLPDGLSIDGVTTEQSCTLNPILHVDILNRAVELALTTRGRVSNRSQGE